MDDYIDIDIDNIDIDSEYAEDTLTLTLPENVDMDYFSVQVYTII